MNRNLAFLNIVNFLVHYPALFKLCISENIVVYIIKLFWCILFYRLDLCQIPWISLFNINVTNNPKECVWNFWARKATHLKIRNFYFKTHTLMFDYDYIGFWGVKRKQVYILSFTMIFKINLYWTLIIGKRFSSC